MAEYRDMKPDLLAGYVPHARKVYDGNTLDLFFDTRDEVFGIRAASFGAYNLYDLCEVEDLVLVNTSEVLVQMSNQVWGAGMN